jgi:toxin ParE1/3/4
MGQISLTLAAERDLIDIYLFGVVEFGAKQAERYSVQISAKMTLIADNPSFGADYSFVQSGLRRAECGAHAIYYRRAGEGILALRILYARMDVGRHLV